MSWTLDPAYHFLAADFGSLAAVFALQGERLTMDPRSEVLRVEREGVRYYVKRYGAGAGKEKNWRLRWFRYLRHYARNFLPRPRVEAEWENLRQFARWDIPVPELVAWGLERRHGAFHRGALITRELVGTEDLASLAARRDQRLFDRRRLAAIGAQIARHTRVLHAHRFIHNDLKWRNILVDAEDRVWFIDCPLGAFCRTLLFERRRIKDLACLDKVARRCLSRTRRLFFYRQYRGLAAGERLSPADKRRIRRIVRFFVAERNDP
ncbi:MAG: protein kinase [Zoogloeaceae bacterium]|jgi:tRNA A-37 threonylcarbamoyl transferase component Bud32|nr:protein kinase [Zoogloeaceae bacterium]